MFEEVPAVPEPCGYWDIMTLPSISPFSESLDVVTAWWKILSHYLPEKEIRVVPKPHMVGGRVVQTLVVEAVFVRHLGLSRTRSTPLFILEYKGPECLPLDGSSGVWNPKASSFYGALEDVLHRTDVDKIYIGLAVGEYVKFWKANMVDGHEGAWEPMVDPMDHVSEQDSSMESFDVADWQDKQKIHNIMNQVASYAHRYWYVSSSNSSFLMLRLPYSACPSWRVE